MSCRKARKQIALWVGNDLSQSELDALEQHIENCSECQERAEALVSSSDVLLAFNSETVRDPSDSVWDGVRQQIELDPRREQRRSYQLTGGLLLTAALLLLAALPDMFAVPPARVIPVGDAPPPAILPPEYAPYYPDPTWQELEALDAPTDGRSTARNAAYGF